ncbi:MAG: HAMP domain-containing sensor histidine kinase [Patescibacteria group bacterium]
MKFLDSKSNVFAECKVGGLSVWECPPFLFMLMGVVNIMSIFATYQVATRASDEPEIAALAAIIVAAMIFLIGSSVVFGFNKVVEANRMKSEFIGVISHQLRSPLSIFKWTLGAIEEELRKELTKTEVQTSIIALNETNQRMIHLVNMLLEVNRIESNRFSLNKKNLSLETLTKEQIETQKMYAEPMGLRIELISEYTDAIHADSDKIQMVIQNLLDNAIRYSKTGGLITIQIEHDKKSVMWKITDMGIGISTEDQKYIFSKFYRGASARAHQAEGNGIGLYIAKTIIENHGGRIGFFSKEGTGTTFWFNLPINIINNAA